MEIFWQNISGHKKIIIQLQKMIKSGHIPHAFLFYGPEGIGKRRVAEAFASALLCAGDEAPCGNCDSCRLLKDTDSRHPDYFFVEPEIHGKSLRTIRIEEIRRLETDLSRLPVLSKRRVVVIDDAWLMNEAAANSLLKTLEEPAGEVVFILIAVSREKLLPTIVSRCTPIAFGPVPTQEMTELLCTRGFSAEQAQAVAVLADGSIGQALKLHAQARDFSGQVISLLEKIDSLSVEKVLADAGEIAALERSEVAEWLRALRLILRDLLVLCSGGTNIFHRALAGRLSNLLPFFSQGRLLTALAVAADFERRINSNANQKLQLEALLLRLQDTIEEE